MTILGKLRKPIYSSIVRNLFISPLNNSGFYLHFIQRARKSGPHARPRYVSQFTRTIDPKTNKEKIVVPSKKNTIAYTDPKNWEKCQHELTDLVGSPSAEEISRQIFGLSSVGLMDAPKNLVLKRKDEPDVEIEEVDLDNFPRPLINGDLGYAVLSQTQEEHEKRLSTVKGWIDTIRQIGIIPGSGRIRNYTCAYAGPLGTLTTSEVLVGDPELAKQCKGKPQYIQNEIVYKHLVRTYTPDNDPEQTYLRPDTDKRCRYVEYDNKEQGRINDGTAEEGKFTISGAYTSHVACLITYQVNDGRHVGLLTEAEMGGKYLVGESEDDLKEYKMGQQELRSPNITSRMHETLFFSTHSDDVHSRVSEEDQIQDLINERGLASGSLLFYTEHNIPNPLAPFGIAMYMTCENGLPIGPYVAEGGVSGYGSNCITYFHTLFLAGGGKLEDLYIGLSDEDLFIPAGGKDFYPFFLDNVLRQLKGNPSYVRRVASAVGEYRRLMQRHNTPAAQARHQNEIDRAREAASEEVRDRTRKDIQLHYNEEKIPEGAEQFPFLSLNSISFTAQKDRMYTFAANINSLTDKQKETEDPDYVKLVEKVSSVVRPRNEDKILEILSRRNAILLCTSSAILKKGLVTDIGKKKREDEDEETPLSIIQNQADTFAEDLLKGKKPDASKLQGNLPPNPEDEIPD